MFRLNLFVPLVIAMTLCSHGVIAQEMKICWDDGPREFCITNERAAFSYSMAPRDRIEYEPSYSDNAGQVRSIGPIRVEYEPSYSDNAGKVRKVGSVSIKYEPSYSDNAGKVRSVGGLRVEYEPSYSNNAGKIRRTTGRVRN